MMSAKYVEQFPDLAFSPLTPPDKHPGYKYGGFHPDRTTILPRGHVKESGFQAFRVDVVFEEDRAIPMRDGVKIYTNIYRPKNAAKVPAILAWSPYGKSGAETAAQNYNIIGPFRMGIPYEKLSGYEKFEGPNPADWCERGYAVVDPDARGAMNSEGDLYFWGPQEALDIYDTLSWIQQQAWCNGSVVMAGNSWLAISQINFASRHHHPVLKAIAPWEALTDPYRHSVCRGGRPAPPGFGDVILAGMAGHSRAENIFRAAEKHPLFDDYWESKVIDVAKVDIPMYLAASYSSGLHSAGSFLTFQIPSKAKKWLRVHSSQEWHDLYRPEVNDDLQKFFDHYTKNIDNGWDKTPPLRLSLIGFNGSPARTVHERPEAADTSFPLSRTRMRQFYLDANTMSMSSVPPISPATASFDSHSRTDKLSFTLGPFKSYTELSGLPWVRLSIHSDSDVDFDIVVQLRKVSLTGTPLEYMNFPAPFPPSRLPNTNVMKYLGPSGILRASHAVSLVPKNHPDEYPIHTHRETQHVEAGKVLALEIPVWPVGMVFEEGESVRVDIAGHDLAYPEFDVGPAAAAAAAALMPPKPPHASSGRCWVHTGGEGKGGSCLFLPFITD